MSMPLAQRLVLVPDPRRPAPSAPVRRYRLARLDLRESPPGSERFAHCAASTTEAAGSGAGREYA